MKVSEAVEQFGMAAIEDKIEVNPLELCIRVEFNSTIKRTRTRHWVEYAIDHVLRLKTWFHSETNSATFLFARCFQAKCPYCKADMVSAGSGGSFSHTKLNFRCECGADISIKLTDNAINVNPGK